MSSTLTKSRSIEVVCESYEKKYGSEFVHAGNIFLRQRGTQVKAGENVGCGRDHTLFATSDGYVHFHKKGPDNHKFVSVLPTKH